MTSKQWKTKLKKACMEAGTYQKIFEIMIDETATILEMRDKAYIEYCDRYNQQITVMHTNQAGAENIARNPAVVEIEALWAQARAHLHDLGLSPKGFRDIGNEIGKKDADAFEKLFEDLGI